MRLGKKWTPSVVFFKDFVKISKESFSRTCFKKLLVKS